MSKTNIESTTLLDLLPTEIIFTIFDYLSSNDIIYTFFFFNQRFKNLLLQNQDYLNYLELPTTNLKIWENILSIIGSQIDCLNINTIDLSFPLRYFSNLKSLIISSSFGLPDEELKSIIESKQFQKLESFKIKDEKIFSNQVYYINPTYKFGLFQRIFNSGKSLQILTIPTFHLQYIHNLTVNLNIHSMTLSVNSFKDIFLLIQSTPNLEYLNVESYQPDANEHQIWINEMNIKLKKLYLTLRYVYEVLNSFDQLTNSIQIFSSSLICLSLNLVHIPEGNLDEIPFNSIKLQQFLESMNELKEFHLYAKLNKHYINCDEVLSGFKSQYWFDNNLSFGMHGEYFYTLPFHFDYLYDFYEGFNDVKSTNPLILINNPRLWYNVKLIELKKGFKYDSNWIKQVNMKMPKLNSITTGYLPISSENNSDEFDNYKDERKIIDIGLNNVTTIQCGSISMKYLKEWFIYGLPSLRRLILRPGSQFSIDNELSRIINGKIQRLDILDSVELEQLEKLNYVYLSNVEYIYFHISNKYKQRADFLMKMLENLKNLKTLTIYVKCQFTVASTSDRTEMNKVIQYLDINQIIKTYQVNIFDKHCLFSRKTF
jgi:hypothetical protein